METSFFKYTFAQYEKRIKIVFLTTVFWLILLSSSIRIPGINLGYLDEGIVIALLPLLFIKKHQTKNGRTLWTLIFFFITYCLISGYYGKYFRGFKLLSLDIFLFLKPVILVLCFSKISINTRKQFIQSVSNIGSLYIYVAIIVYVLNAVFKFLPVFDRRLGLDAYSFIANTPGELLNNLTLIGFTIILNKQIRHKKLILVLVGFLIFSTLRFKGFVMLLLATLIFYYFHRKRMNGKFVNINQELMSFLRKPQTYFILILGLIPGWQQFQKYFLGEITPRLLFVTTSFDITTRFFPFGTGPGTFGSAVAKTWYSPVYLNYGFDSIYGLSGTGDNDFLSDNFWPMVFGQYGVIGFILVILIYRKILTLVSKSLIEDKYVFEIFLLITFSLLLSTLGSAILIGSLGILYMMLLGSIINTNKTTA